MARSVTDRSDHFKVDEMVVSGSASDDNYRGSGYDRGHLVPAGDLAFSRDTLEITFYYSNIPPSDSDFQQRHPE